MKLWVLFLFGSLLTGAVSMRGRRAGQPPRRLLMLAMCVVVAAAFYSQRFG